MTSATRNAAPRPRTGSGLPRRAWRTDEVAEMLGISTDLVLDLHHSGELGFIRAGSRYLTPTDEFERYCTALRRGENDTG